MWTTSGAHISRRHGSIRFTVVDSVRSASRWPQPPCFAGSSCDHTRRSTVPAWCQLPPRRSYCERSDVVEKRRQLAGSCWRTEPRPGSRRPRAGVTKHFQGLPDRHGGADDRERNGSGPETPRIEWARSWSYTPVTKHIDSTVSECMCRV